MKANRIHCILLLLLSLSGTVGGSGLWAQDNSEKTERSFDETTWDELEEELDYSGEAPKKKEAKDIDYPEMPDFPTLPFFWQVVLLIIMLSVLAYLIYKLILSNERSTKITTTASDIEEPSIISIEELEENLDKNEVLPLLLDAERAGNYHLAVRLHYLALLKKLHDNGVIQWKKQLTNRVYLRQMRNHPHFTDFQALTLTFERVWYGNHIPELVEYQQISRAFTAFPHPAAAEKAAANG